MFLTDQNARSGDMTPLFEAIIKHVPAPVAKADHLQFLITNLGSLRFLRADCDWPNF